MSAPKKIDVEAWKRNLRVAADAPVDDDACTRWFNNYFAFWHVCETGACKRGKRCAGDADACRDRFMPLVPQRMKFEVQATLKARTEGLSPDAVMRKVREELARFDETTRRLEALGMSGARAVYSPPLGGVGFGVGVPKSSPPVGQTSTPLPNPPPQGGREQTECAERNEHTKGGPRVRML